MILVLMGVAGSGKTRVGRLLADALGWPFFDADDFHPRDNIERMRGGIPLADADREPWLEALRALVSRVERQGGNAVLACSALRKDFRERLRDGRDVRYVHLRADPKLIAARLAAREGHFMRVDLLESQYAALEEPNDSIVLGASDAPEVLVARIRAAVQI